MPARRGTARRLSLALVGVLALEAALFRQPAVVGVAIALAVLELAAPRLAPGLVMVRLIASGPPEDPPLDARPQLVAFLALLAAALSLVAVGASAAGYGVAAGAGAAALAVAILARPSRS